MSNDEIILIQNEIKETTNQVQQNISLVIDRGDKLDNLEEKSNNLMENSHIFRNSARKLKWKMFMKKLKIVALLILIIFILIMMFLFTVCGWKLHC